MLKKLKELSVIDKIEDFSYRIWTDPVTAREIVLTVIIVITILSLLW